MAESLEDIAKIAEETSRQINIDDDPIRIVESVYHLLWCWADFELTIVSPTISPVFPPIIIPPEAIPQSNQKEFVYPIQDFGYKLTTSKGEDMFNAGLSMCKLYYTIEKMVYLLIERLKTGGVDEETEVQVAFGGQDLAKRKAFESIINLNYNVVVTNFDPGAWGERYLQIVKRLADRGYGYPPEAPRDRFRQMPGTTPSISR